MHLPTLAKPILPLTVVLVACTMSVSAPAQTTWLAPDPHAPTARVTMNAYVNEALRTNLSLAAQTADVARADAAVREAHGRFMPSVSVNARYSELSGVVNIGDFINPAYAALNQVTGTGRFPTNISSTLPARQETKLELVVPVYNATLGGASTLAARQRDVAGSSYRLTMRQLAADVQLSWLAYASAVRAAETLDAATVVLEENVRVSERRVNAGDLTPDVLLRAKAELSDVRQQSTEARRQTRAAAGSFNLLRNQNSDAAIAIGDDSTLSPADTITRSALIEYALSHREELQQADGAIRIAAAAQRVASAPYKPSVALAASYGVQGDQYRFDTRNDVAIASLVLSWNVFNGGQDRARVAQSVEARNEATYRRRELERAVQLQVNNAYDAIISARSSVVAADDRYTAASRAFTLVERRYAEGLATHIEFLSARSASTSAALNQVLTHYTLAARAVELERAAALRTFSN